MKMWQDLMLSNYMLYPLAVNLECNADWYKEHNRSMKQEVYYVKFDNFFIGKSFNQASRLIYSSKNSNGFNGPLLIGVMKVEKETKRKHIYMNPKNFIIEKEHKAIVISEEENVAKMVEKFMDNYFDTKIVNEYQQMENDIEKHINQGSDERRYRSNSSSEKHLNPKDVSSPIPKKNENFIDTTGVRTFEMEEKTNTKLIQSSEINGMMKSAEKPLLNGGNNNHQNKTDNIHIKDYVNGDTQYNPYEIITSNNYEDQLINNIDIEKYKDLFYQDELQNSISAMEESYSVKRKPKLSNNYYVLWNNDLRGLIEGHIIVIGSKPTLFDIVKEIRV